MKIGIDARAASHPRRGGMKTYTENLLRAFAQMDGKDEYLIYFDRPHQLDFDLPGNFSTFEVSGSLKLVGAGWREQWKLPQKARQDEITLLHSMSNTAPIRGHFNSIVTLHDVIALTEPQVNYEFSLAAMILRLIGLYGKVVVPIAAKQLTAIITVSNYEKKQIVKHLDVSPEKIFVTHLAPSEYFKPLSPSEIDEARSTIKEKYNIDIPYLMGVGFEPRKNLNSLIQAYASLDESLKKRSGVVIVCANEGIADEINHQANNLGIGRQVTVLPGVDHSELRLLYGLASALVFPSLRESFGLPPIEAMACGTPVIASNTSSLPEILEEAPLYVDPTDVRAIKEAITAALTNIELSNTLREKGLARSQQFTWERTASETLKVYEWAAREKHG